MSDEWKALDTEALDLEQARQNYAFASWSQPEQAGRSFWIGFAALLRSFEGHTVSADQRVLRSDPVCTSASFRIEAANGSGFIALLRECDDVPSAHLALLGDLSTVMLSRLPSGDELGLKCGDICFADLQESPLLMFFTRYNLSVKVAHAYGPRAGTTPLALHIDGLLQKNFIPSPGGPCIDVFTAQRSPAPDEAGINLVVTSRDGQRWAAKASSETGQIRRKDGRLSLTAASSSAVQVSVQAISAAGPVSVARTGVA